MLTGVFELEHDYGCVIKEYLLCMRFIGCCMRLCGDKYRGYVSARDICPYGDRETQVMLRFCIFPHVGTSRPELYLPDTRNPRRLEGGTNFLSSLTMVEIDICAHRLEQSRRDANMGGLARLASGHASTAPDKEHG